MRKLRSASPEQGAAMLTAANRVDPFGSSGPLLVSRIHGSYLRFPGDLPTAGKRIVLSLRVRRFTCMESSCPRRTFAEQVSGLTRRYGGRTERLRFRRASVGLAGRAGAQMADAFGAPVSRNALLRLIASIPDLPAATPRVVGVDEHTQRRGRIYGTVVVDVETRRPVDLLPDCEADTCQPGWRSGPSSRSSNGS